MSLKKPDNISQEQWDSLSETEKNDVWKEEGLTNFSAGTDKFRKVTDENGKTLHIFSENSKNNPKEEGIMKKQAYSASNRGT